MEALFFIIAYLAAAIILIIFFAVKIKATVSYRNGRIKAVVTWFCIPLFHIEYVLRRDEDKLFTLHVTDKKKKEHTISLEKIIRLFAPKKEKEAKTKEALAFIHSKAEYEIEIKFIIGTGDAVLTALSCGLLQSVIGTCYAMRKNSRMKLKSAVIPQFTKQTLCFDADCIIKAYPANIIFGYMIYKKIIRR